MQTSADQEQLLLGGLELERDLGEGAMGKVQLRRSKRSGERFAVKRASFQDWPSQRGFLVELMSWYGLPRHPHLVECRFLRTLQDDATGARAIAIFAEYVPGGSLADWIAQGKLRRLDQILDVAIQLAWGLDAAHRLGVVHQDVKPGNVLLAPEAGPSPTTAFFFSLDVARPPGASSESRDSRETCVVKVADFGLARAARLAQMADASSGESGSLTGRLFSSAYCSPEHVAGAQLTSKTDVWSWGLCVLDMLRGKANKSRGSRAPSHLEAYLKTAGPGTPSGLIDILAKSFRTDPDERWESMADVARALCDLYRHALKQEYTRLPPPGDAMTRAIMDHHRRPTSGQRFGDPRPWLERALIADGQAAESSASFLVQAISPRAQPIADVIGYEEARRILERLFEQGQWNDGHFLAQLCAHKALVHAQMSDGSGAEMLYDRAIAIDKQLIHQGRQDLAEELAGLYQSKALELAQRGDPGQAVTLYDRAITIGQRLLQQGGPRKRAERLARVYHNKALALGGMGELRQAVAACDQAIAIRAQLSEDGCQESSNDLAATHKYRATALRRLEDLPQAVAACDQAIALWKRLLQHQGSARMLGDIARTRLVRAKALLDMGERDRARTDAREAVEILRAESRGAQRPDTRAALDFALTSLSDLL